MKVYKKMASENIKYCLIFEDDVIGSDQDINKVVEIYKKLPKNSILLAGGMDGIKFKKYLYGKEIFTNVYQINPLYYQFLVRACCYVIPLDLAKKILRMQENCLIRADEWGEFLMKENNVFVSPIFHHPLDLTNSHIEKSRRKELNNVFQRLLQEGIIFTFLRVIQRGFLRILAKLKGLDSIFK
jgi:glycosyl transferase family 25